MNLGLKLEDFERWYKILLGRKPQAVSKQLSLFNSLEDQLTGYFKRLEDELEKSKEKRVLTSDQLIGLVNCMSINLLNLARLTYSDKFEDAVRANALVFLSHPLIAFPLQVRETAHCAPTCRRSAA